jgi:hypothetical protein
MKGLPSELRSNSVTDLRRLFEHQPSIFITMRQLPAEQAAWVKEGIAKGYRLERVYSGPWHFTELFYGPVTDPMFGIRQMVAVSKECLVTKGRSKK